MGSNIVEFKDISATLRFVVRSIYENLYEDKETREFVKEKRAFICLVNSKNKHEIVHPMSGFILDMWKSNKYNTQRQKAYHIVSFLNYIMIEKAREFDLHSMSEIEFYHGTKFLNYLTSRGDKKNTVKRYEYTISEFYKYLADKGLLKEVKSEEFKYGYYKKRGEYIKSPFKGVHYDNKKSIRVIHELKPEFVIAFLETAYHEVPRIALGVYYQIFGGFRVGDVVNTSRDSITCIEPYGEFGQIIDIRKRDLFTDNSSDGSNYVKKERDQYVFPYKKILPYLYRNHLKNYITNHDIAALFQIPKGNAMSGAMYRYYFNKVKIKFIDKLIETGDTRIQNYALFLKSVKWSTHIGRGIFSNSIAEVSKTALEIANLRGDSTLDASLTYIENTNRLQKKLEEYMERMYVDGYFNKKLNT